MSVNLSFFLMLAAVIVTGLLAGVSLDKAIVQLPARYRMGISGFAAFSRANDLGNGLIVYPVLGIGAALLTLIAALVVFLQRPSLAQAWPLYISAILALLHSAATALAAPNMLRLRQPGQEEAQLAAVFDRFARWHRLRAILQLLNFLLLVWAVIAYLRP